MNWGYTNIKFQRITEGGSTSLFNKVKLTSIDMSSFVFFLLSNNLLIAKLFKSNCYKKKVLET